MLYTIDIIKKNNHLHMDEHSHNHNEQHNHTSHEGNHAQHQEHGHKHSARSAASSLKNKAGALEAMLVPIFANLPHLPENWKQVLTKIISYLALVFGVLGVIGLIGAGAIAALLSPLLMLSKGFFGIVQILTLLFSFATAILSIMAFKPLKAMRKQGWDYLFYSLVISTISTLVGILTMYGSSKGIIMILITTYVLFEIREKYH